MRRYLLEPSDGPSTFHATLQEAGKAFDRIGLDGRVTDLKTGRIVLGRGSGYFGIGTALMLGIGYREDEAA